MGEAVKLRRAVLCIFVPKDSPRTACGPQWEDCVKAAPSTRWTESGGRPGRIHGSIAQGMTEEPTIGTVIDGDPGDAAFARQALRPFVVHPYVGAAVRQTADGCSES